MFNANVKHGIAFIYTNQPKNLKIEKDLTFLIIHKPNIRISGGHIPRPSC